ncbi:MAG TPA: YceI family protein [Zeimonas sp.]|nr:YceI family protein [Zeimonas sp.]
MTYRSILGLLVLASAVTGAARAAPAHYVVEPKHTFTTFEVRHFNTSTVRARFERTDGSIVLDRDARTGRAEIVIDTASVSSGIADFDKHLKTADFLDSARVPKARFVGTQFSFDGDKVTAVTGDLTLLDKTLPITLKATNFNCYDSPILKARVCGGDFEAVIKRSRWGMSWGIDKGIPDDVRLLIQIEAVQK